MVHGIVKYFWPSVREDEIRKFSLLSLTFFCIIGSYWLFRLLKDLVFMKIAFPEALGWAPHTGRLFTPIAKTISPFVVIACVLIYSKLVDIFKKHQLFYAVCSFYAVIFGSITALLIARNIGGDALLGKNVLAGLGWVTYLGIESFGSIVIPLFWSFVISITATESSKVGFPIIIAGAQFGAIGGSALPIFAEKIGGVWQLFLIGTITVICVMFLIAYFMKTTPANQLVGDKAAAAAEKDTQQKKPGFIRSFLDGLILLTTRPYLMGVFIVSTFYEVVGTIIDYQMKSQASIYPEFAGEAGFAKFLGIFGVCSNGLALIVALLGASYLLKQFGIRFCLLVYPACFGAALGIFYALNTFLHLTPAQSLWATFAVMMVVKGMSYAVNNPTKEMMYIPTSKAAKFKAKGWTDMFGGRMAKAAGSQVTNALKHNMEHLISYGTIFGLAMIGVWSVAAYLVGTKNEELVRKGEIID